VTPDGDGGVRTVIAMAVLACVAGCLACVAVHDGDSAAVVQSRSGVTTVEGTSIHYDVSGTGQPILLLHAGVADSRMWDEQVRALSPYYTVIRCDLRGFGRTPAGLVPFSHYRDVAALLDST
jgi:hypothetical protein